jgi:hypothetical protein
MEDGMRKALLALGVVPLVSGTAVATQPLTDNQMDGVNAGFSAMDQAPRPRVQVPQVRP